MLLKVRISLNLKVNKNDDNICALQLNFVKNHRQISFDFLYNKIM